MQFRHRRWDKAARPLKRGRRSHPLFAQRSGQGDGVEEVAAAVQLDQVRKAFEKAMKLEVVFHPTILYHDHPDPLRQLESPLDSFLDLRNVRPRPQLDPLPQLILRQLSP